MEITNPFVTQQWRFQLILIDEARLVRSDIIKDVLEPMTNTPRTNNIMARKTFPEAKIEEGRMIYISSAWLKTCDLYQRFLSYYNNMKSGNNGYFVASLDYRVGIDAGLWTAEKMEDKRNDPNVTWDSWLYEYSNAPYIRNYIMKIQQIFEKKVISICGLKKSLTF